MIKESVYWTIGCCNSEHDTFGTFNSEPLAAAAREALTRPGHYPIVYKCTMTLKAIPVEDWNDVEN